MSIAASSKSIRNILLRFGFLVVFALFFGFFAAWNPLFLQGENLTNIVEGSAILMIVAIAMTLIVATGGIDLSIGIALDFGAAFAIVAMKSYGLDWLGAACLGVIGGSIVGMLNALLVVGLRISPFLATLSTFFIGSSVQRIFTNGGGPISFRRMPTEFRNIAQGELFGIPVEVLVAIAVALIYIVILELSVWGRQIHAMGMQRSASIVAGIRTNRNLVLAFVIASSTCAIAGLIAAANIRMFTPLSGFAYLLDAIAATFNRRSAPSAWAPKCNPVL